MIQKTGFPDAVVWNPWIDKAAGMADFGDDEYKVRRCLWRPSLKVLATHSQAAQPAWHGHTADVLGCRAWCVWSRQWRAAALSRCSRVRHGARLSVCPSGSCDSQSCTQGCEGIRLPMV